MQEKKYHVILLDRRTAETKFFHIEKSTYAEAASYAYLQARKMFEITGNTWEIISVYDTSHEIDLFKRVS